MTACKTPYSFNALMRDTTLSFFRFMSVAWFAVLMLAAAPSFAQSSQPQFALAKNICTGNVAQIIAAGNGLNPAACPLASTVVASTDAYYVITVTNPWGQPAQQVSLNDALPAGFTQNGVIVCRDDANPMPNVITLGSGSGPNSIGTVPLAVGATVHCFIQGSFASPAPNTNATRINTVTASNGGSAPFNMTASVTSTVIPSTPLLTDLSVTKTSSAPINISSGGASITYTIVIKNNGPIDADVANFFTLQDSFSLPTNGVPLNVEYVSAACVATAGTSCLAAGGPTLLGTSPLFVGPTGQTNFFSWGFDAGNGMIKSGGEITLTITVNVSQVTGINCVAALNANGLVNQAFFTLASQTSAYSELNPANNTSTVTTGVTTGQTQVDPNCGKGHLKLTKVQISPPPGTVVPWGTKVTYAITIENMSIPDQKITIDAAGLQDWVTEGINTPPFTRTHINTSCVNSTNPGLCSSFNPGLNFDPDYKYKFYGETKKAWETNQAMVLSLAESVTFNTTFVYEKPDCETVPNVKTNPIMNTARLSYLASGYGAVDGSVQDVTFNLQASAQTDMEPMDPCSFVVTKKMATKTPRIQFGSAFSYDITYTNNGAPRTVGTLLDVVRLTIPNYATNVPYVSNWKCSASAGVTGATLIGSINGNATYTANPMQGSPAANLGSNIFFPAGGSLKCTVNITVNRPAPNDPFCTQDKTEFENLALMDVTHPFNSNIAWPPSSTYNPASASNPPPQVVNWAAVKAQLPACWDATVNKSATVVGLPLTTAPWTYVGGPAINYVITTTNKGQSPLGNPNSPPAKPQWFVEDNFTTPYLNANATAGSPLCVPNTPWCHSAPAPLIPKSKIAVKTLAPLSAGQWNLQYPGPFVASKPIKNCANLTPDFGGEVGNYYQNTQPIQPPACITIPVVDVTKLTVTKVLIDNTGANQKVGGPYVFNVSCSLYPAPTAVANFSLYTSSSGSSAAHTVFPVAMGSVCTIVETSAPIPAASALACGGAANVDAQVTYAQPPNPLNPQSANNSAPNSATVTNTLKCKTGVLNVTKVVAGSVLPPAFANISKNYSISVACNPAGTPTTLLLNAGASSASGNVTAPLNASCTVTEPPTALPTNVVSYCASLGQTASWDPVTIAPASPIIITAGTNAVTVTNKWKCSSPASMFHVHKKLDPGPGGVQLTGLQFTIQTNCTPTAANFASVTGTSLPASSNFPNGNMIGLIIQPAGSTCAFSEPILPNFPQAAITQCLPNGDPVWSTPTFVAMPNIMTVTNAWTCVPKVPGAAQLTINKVVTGPAPTVILPPSAPLQAYDFTGTCLASLAPVSASGTTNGSGVFNVTAGSTSCTLSEAAPAMPPLLSNYCALLGQVAVWDAPSYNPSSTIPIVSGNNTVTVTNNWKCAPSLKVKKEVKGPIMPLTVTQPPTTPAQNYTISATCTGMASPLVFNLNASESTPATGILAANLNSTCTLTESPPSTPSSVFDYCNQLYFGNNGNPYVVEWEAPVFLPATPITIGQIVGAGVTVTNKWKCVPPPAAGTVQFYKVIEAPIGAASVNWSGTTFEFQAGNATPQSVTLPVSAGGISMAYSALMTVPVGASLAVTEVLPAFPSGASTYCSAQNGQIPSWKQPVIKKVVSSPPPVYAPITLPITMTSGLLRLAVFNTWECVTSGAQGAGGVNLRVIAPPTKPPVGSQIELVKQISGPASLASSLSFGITANCTPIASQGRFNIVTDPAGNGAVKIDVTSSAQCSFTQVRPALPSTAQAFCARTNSTAQWNPTIPFSSASAGQRLVLQDSWACVPSAIKPTPVPQPTLSPTSSPVAPPVTTPRPSSVPRPAPPSTAPSPSPPAVSPGVTPSTMPMTMPQQPLRP
jgi:Domain of unknown function (DUF5979)/Domain of unknown function DUF11